MKTRKGIPTTNFPTDRRRYWLFALVGAILPTTILLQAAQTSSDSAIERMQRAGPEVEQLRRRAGVWSVTNTIRATPDAAPAITPGLVAERNMVGQYLEEVIKPAAGSKVPDFRRISYLYYSPVEGRWQYVSMDTRLPVGIMPAWSFGRETNRKITLLFEGLGFVGLGRDVDGRLVRSNLELTVDTDDHEFARQYWVQADGTGRQWLAVEYEYTRSK